VRAVSDVLQRGSKRLLARFSPAIFAGASLAAAVILVSLVAIPQWLSKQARWEVLRAHVAQISRLAASVIDGDLHRQLLDRANYSPELYARALKPLVRFHSANRDIFYVYTMVDRGGVAYFVLDTAASPDLVTPYKLRASGYMERFDLHEEYEDNWLKQIAAGQTYVTPDFEQDDYGYFLTAHTPIYDSQGRYSGFVGVDFDLDYYLAQEARFRTIAIWTLAAAVVAALLIGALISLYHASLRGRMEELYDKSIRDSLTGLLNRRGAIETINAALACNTGTNATLLLDIDNLKPINDFRGHVTGDAVITRTALAIQEGIRQKDVCARIGGDEFIIFAPNCDMAGAEDIAQRIQAKLSKPELLLAEVRFSVSIGIAVHANGDYGFAQMYRDADEALHQARAEGKSRIGYFAPSTSAA
jgi:diguanylate cyclase (GGDEF)-like protein